MSYYISDTMLISSDPLARKRTSRSKVEQKAIYCNKIGARRFGKTAAPTVTPIEIATGYNTKLSGPAFALLVSSSSVKARFQIRTSL